MKIALDNFFYSVAKRIIYDPEYQSMKKYVAHGRYSVYDHSLRVAIYAYSYAKERSLDIDYESLIIGALLHDYYLYDWHKRGEGHRFHGLRHPFFAFKKAKRRYKLTPKICNMIRSHMFPFVFWVLPLSKEAWVLQKADKRCAIIEHKTHKIPRKASNSRIAS